jgi:signal transduction histidine kinase
VVLPPTFYQEFFDRLERCVFVVDSQQCLTALNPAARTYFERVHGVTLILGDSLPPQLPTRLRERWERRFIETWTEGHQEGPELQLGEQGTTFLEARYERIETAEGTWIAAAWRDVTETRQKEDGFRQLASDLQSAKQTRETALAVLGHDLRSPIAQLNALIFLMRNSKLSKESLENHLASLESTTHFLAETLENTLFWATLQRNTIEPQRVTFDARQLLRQSYGLHASAAAQKGIEVVIEEAESLFIRTDRQMLGVFQRNLIANAVKFTSNAGRIEIRHALEADGAYRFSVSDNGIGMDEATRRSLLSAEQTRSRPGTLGERGMGFGLNVCREFLEKLEGTLEIESRVDGGTCVAIRLPAAAADDALPDDV